MFGYGGFTLRCSFDTEFQRFLPKVRAEIRRKKVMLRPFLMRNGIVMGYCSNGIRNPEEQVFAKNQNPRVRTRGPDEQGADTRALYCGKCCLAMRYVI